MNLIEAIKDWPVIVQGALGSFAFWLVLKVATSAYAVVSSAYAKRSRKSKKQRLLDEKLLIYANMGKQFESGYLASLIWYRASRKIVNALLWVTLGLLVSTFVPFLSVIGYAGAIYYLLAAKVVVDPYKHKGSLDERLEVVQNQIDALKSSEKEDAVPTTRAQDA